MSVCYQRRLPRSFSYYDRVAEGSSGYRWPLAPFRKARQLVKAAALSAEQHGTLRYYVP